MIDAYDSEYKEIDIDCDDAHGVGCWRNGQWKRCVAHTDILVGTLEAFSADGDMLWV